MRIFDGRHLTEGIIGYWNHRKALIVLMSLLATEANAMSMVPDWMIGTAAEYPKIDIIWLPAILAPLVAAIFLLLINRRRILRFIQFQGLETADFKCQLDRFEALLESDDQQHIIWNGSQSEPIVMGKLPEHCEIPQKMESLITFDAWLTPSSAEKLGTKVTHLLQQGIPFCIIIETLAGVFLEASARTAGGLAVVRLKDLSSTQPVQAEQESAKLRLSEEKSELARLLDMLTGPAWIRNRQGKLKWVNNAYVAAAGASSTDEVIKHDKELLGELSIEALNKQRDENGFAKLRVSIEKGNLSSFFDVHEVSMESGSAGVAIDVSELEAVRLNLQKTLEFHAQSLDQLATAVAIYGPDRHLQYYNEAFQRMWDLDTAFLQSRPEDSEVLNELRIRQKLPEVTDFRNWRENLHLGYDSSKVQEYNWYLPDGRTLRVISNPHPQGGVIYIYENVTEQLSLESRYNELAKVQGETLDRLTEAVSVFGTNGRLKLWNPAFAKIWGIERKELKNTPHVSSLAALVKGDKEAELWNRLVVEVTSQTENRVEISGKFEMNSGIIVDFATLPLADGGMMVTFVDVTDSANVERALREKNEALELADQLKDTFIQHVSYELRTPLTNIIGFANLLSKPETGEMNAKQDEYTGYILESSSVLLALIDNILDLATIDAGIMKLEVEQVDINDTVVAAIEGIKDRLTESNIALRKQIPEGIGSFVADGSRVRQILYNLISNAVRFSNKGASIDIICEKNDNFVIFTIKDFGIGIPDDLLPDVFGNFVGRGQENKRSGAGLGLPIVKKFVELHGGRVEIESEVGQGTSVRVWFPLVAKADAQQAAE